MRLFIFKYYQVTFTAGYIISLWALVLMLAASKAILGELLLQPMFRVLSSTLIKKKNKRKKEIKEIWENKQN